jgi:lysozyme
VQPSEDCYKLTEASEGCRLKAYQDTGGVWTIGYGHTSGVRSGQVITFPLAVTLLKHDMQSAANFVNSHALPCTQGQFDALTDFVFNVGPGQFLSSHLLKYHKTGEHEKAAAEFPKWKYDNGKIEPGLVTRRAAERSLYSHQGLPEVHQHTYEPEHSGSSTVCFGPEDLGPESDQFLTALLEKLHQLFRSQTVYSLNSCLNLGDVSATG